MLTKTEQDELIEQYNQCNDGLICVDENELKESIEYYMDKHECITMINSTFSQEDSIIHITDNNYGTDYLELYNKNDKDVYNEKYGELEPSVMYIICPKGADKKYKQWFADIINFVYRKSENHYKRKNVNIICHDECCQTWDTLDLYSMRANEKYTECTTDHCDYERYDDIDIANLTEKIENDWYNVKKRIEDVISRRAYGYAYKMNGFCMIIEEGR